jgi:hypothetical protein
VALVGTQACQNTSWLSDHTVLCAVPAVLVWGGVSDNATLCAEASPQLCQVDHAVTVAFNLSQQELGDTISASNRSYVYGESPESTLAHGHGSACLCLLALFPLCAVACHRGVLCG